MKKFGVAALLILSSPSTFAQTPASCLVESADISVKATKKSIEVDFCVYGKRDSNTSKRCLPNFKEVSFDNFPLALDTYGKSDCDSVSRAYTLTIPSSNTSEHNFTTEDEFGIRHGGEVDIAKIELLSFPDQVSLGLSPMIKFNSEPISAKYDEEKLYVLATEGSPVTILQFSLDQSEVIPSYNVRQVRPNGGMASISLVRYISTHVDGYPSNYWDGGAIFSVNP